MKEEYDVIIVGGSYAGLSAALTLGRSRRKVLIIDNDEPCNRQSPWAHNFITHDGENPSSIISTAKREVLNYPTVSFEHGIVTNVSRQERKRFRVETDNQAQMITKKILFSTGLLDDMPLIKGLSECWGISVLHCPYCHGYEVRDRRTAVFANGDHGYELCGLLTNWTQEIVLLTNGKSTVAEKQLKKLQSSVHLELIEKEIDTVEHKDGQIELVYFKDGSHLSVPIMYARIPVKQHCPIPEKLGCKLTAHGLLRVDDLQETSIAGIYAAGDNAFPARIISYAVAAGTRAGIAINAKLVAEVV